MSQESHSATPPTERFKITEVRYSLPIMLEELKAERASSSFAMEQLDQHEIGKIFKTKGTRAKSRSKK